MFSTFPFSLVPHYRALSFLTPVDASFQAPRFTGGNCCVAARPDSYTPLRDLYTLPMLQ